MLQVSIDYLLYSILGLDKSLLWVQGLNFFIYDSIKILVLLFLMISVVGFLRTYLPQKKVKEWLSGKRMGIGNILAATFGAVTPFCSCSSIPIFIGFIKAGVPLGVSFSFLITSPLINEYLVVLMLAFFGWKITLAYVISGMLLGIFGGLILGRMNLEKYLDKEIANHSKIQEKHYKTVHTRLRFGLNESLSIVKKLWVWVLVGVGLSAIIHNFVPEDMIHSLISATGPFTVPLATLIGIPIYASCAAIVPIAVALFQKGIPIGTLVALMMSMAALSLPEAVILRRAMKLKLILIFFGIVALAIMFTGYLLNFLQPILVG